mmetsp:Transcript_2572/g.3820  ORF Transcript_2572/g.3820 Transcript_2572/m.3820 type:complete len:822 (-) Transcript_2572:66-2531(-)
MSVVEIPFKKSQTANLKLALKNYINKEYGAAEAAKYDDDLNFINNSRKSATLVNSASENGRKSLEDYIALLSTIENLFPISEKDINLPFTWHDSFVPSKNKRLCSIIYDKACIYYNLAVLESCQSYNSDMNTEAGLKSAFQHFTLSAGIFLHIRDGISPNISGVMTPDLSPTGLTMAYTIMIAQAQGCCFERFLRQKKTPANKKSGLLAKIAIQASEYFRAAAELASSPDMVHNVEKSFSGKLSFQKYVYTAHGEYWQAEEEHAIADEKGAGYGGVIARLEAALKSTNMAKQLGKKMNIGPALINPVNSLDAVINNKKSVLVKDNQSIYLEAVPSVGSLAPIKKSVAAHPAAVPKFKSNTEVFVGMLSKREMEALSEYQKEAQTALGDAIDRSSEAENRVKGKLEEVGLPGSIEGDQCEEGISNEMWGKVVRANENGGLEEIRNLIVEKEKLAAMARKMLTNIEFCLQQEQEKDESFRERYKDSAAEVSNQKYYLDLKKDIAHFVGMLDEAKSADEKIMVHLDKIEIKESLQLIGLRREELDSRLPKKSSKAAAEANPLIEALSSALGKLSAEMERREKLTAELVELKRGDRKFKELLRSGKNSGEARIELLRVVQESAAELSAVVEGLGKSLEEVLELEKMFQEAREGEEASKLRDLYMASLNKGISEFHKVHAQLVEGISFYKELGGQIELLQQTSEDTIYTRGLQRREIQMHHTRRLEQEEQEANDALEAAKLEGGQRAGKVPPPLPPKPSGLNLYPKFPATEEKRRLDRPLSPKSMPLEPRLASIVEMGFHPDTAQRALQEAKGDLQLAIDRLLGNS